MFKDANLAAKWTNLAENIFFKLKFVDFIEFFSQVVSGRSQDEADNPYTKVIHNSGPFC